MALRLRTGPTGRRRVSYRVGRGLWVSEDADQNLSADPAGRAFCAFLFVVDAALVVLAALRNFQLPIPNQDAAVAIAMGAVIALPFLLYVDWRVNRFPGVVRHTLYGAAVGAALRLLAGAPT